MLSIHFGSARLFLDAESKRKSSGMLAFFRKSENTINWNSPNLLKLIVSCMRKMFCNFVLSVVLVVCDFVSLFCSSVLLERYRVGKRRLVLIPKDLEEFFYVFTPRFLVFTPQLI